MGHSCFIQTNKQTNKHTNKFKSIDLETDEVPITPSLCIPRL